MVNRRSFITKASGILAAFGAVGLTTAVVKGGTLGKPEFAYLNLLPLGAIPTVKDFEELLKKGHEEFIIAYQLDDKILWDETPFDRDDAMSYMVTPVIFNSPMGRVYLRNPKITGEELQDQIVPFIHGCDYPVIRRD